MGPRCIRKFSELDAKLTDLIVTLEDTLLAETDDVESSVVVSTTELTYSLPRNATRLIWLSMLALACIVVFVIGYKWIRYNLMAGLALATSIALEVATLVAALVAFRIPVNYNFAIPFVVMLFTTIINATLMNNSIKAGLNNEAYNKTTNADRVLMATKSNLKGIIIYMSMLVAAVLGLVFFGNASMIYLGIATVVGLIISAFVSLLINNALWSFWDKKDKDRSLIRRINAEKKRIEAKNNKNKQVDEKIVV